jgi:TonB family protein
VSLNETGGVTDVRILSSSLPEFGLALAAAVQGFAYSPGLANGKIVPGTMEFSQDFDVSDFHPQEAERLLAMEAKPGLIHRISELDARPHPRTMWAPLYPSALISSSVLGNSVVECLIDEKGAVCLPRVVSASQPEFGYAAVQAIGSWTFDPPTIHGQPVVARVRVPFKFKPKAAEPRTQ